MRQIINTKQHNNTASYYYNGRPISFDRKEGTYFSDKKEMDDCVNYFLNLDGFELVSEKKKEEPKQEPPKMKNTSQNVFKKENRNFNKKSKEE